MKSEVAQRAEFATLRYAQCWEDADILLDALDIQSGHVCLSIASAGDNALAMLSRGPARVIALDLNPAQLACVELRVAAYRALEHHELLELIGSVPSRRRPALYQRCRKLLTSEARGYWDAHALDVAQGIGAAGKFERYFALFRQRVLPLVHSQQIVNALLRSGTPEERERFYVRQWDTWRWRLLFQIFYSRFVMGRLGRDPEFFRYVEGNVAKRILKRTHYALTQLNPADNPYMTWILTGQHSPQALPFALRQENFDPIRRHLDRLELRQQSLEDFLAECDAESVDRYNLSDIFEYMSPESHCLLLKQLVRAGSTGARLAYWNMLAERHRPETMVTQLRSLDELAQRLFAQDKAFFYRAFVVEEVIAGGSGNEQMPGLTNGCRM